MAKCRTLQEENEEIGAVASEGKIHEMAMKMAVLKTQNTELKNQFEAKGAEEEDGEGLFACVGGGYIARGREDEVQALLS
ncbi:FKBP12-interacting protein of 37 kDa [Platanthera guangdongensis]|uniref:FKBP12-interacting protein of 37 kDa n=1 Tax=Platanthera guangdongensis TaxID=2320717 RepID=A0ABR2M9T7_9ASPA